MKKQTVWKYKIKQGETLEIPKGALFLYTEAVQSNIFVWALVEPDEAPDFMKVLIVETGEIIEDSCSLEYMGTVSTNSGYRVHHIFKTLD